MHRTATRADRRRRLSLVLALVCILSVLPVLPGALASGGDAATRVTQVPEWAPARSGDDARGAPGGGPVEEPGWMYSPVLPADDLGVVGIEIPWDADETFEVRTRQDGAWGPWTDVAIDFDEGPDPGSREWHAQKHVSNPIWVGGSDALQLRTEGERAPRDVRLHAVAFRGGVQVTSERPVQTAEAASAAAPRLITRSEWDPQNKCVPRQSATLASNARFAVVHHTASSNSYADREAAAAAVLSICLFHRNSNGWDDIGYNFLVDRFGNIYEGRNGGFQNAPVGAHAGGWNSGSIGVAVLGCHTSGGERGCEAHDVSSSTDRSRAMVGVDRLLAWKFGLHGIDPGGTTVEQTNNGETRVLRTITGHRDLGSTTCPGGHLYTRVADSGSDPMAPRVAGRLQLMPVPWATWGVGDRDGDGREDLVAIGDEGDSRIWMGQSAGDYLRARTDTAYTTKSGWDTHLLGDFDGDGQTDVASYHPSNGTWWVATGARRGQDAALWGRFETRTGWAEHRVADVDGDGRDDIVSFHPSNGTWWVSRSTPTAPWPQRGRLETSKWSRWRTTTGWEHGLVGDFNADGREDLATFHVPTGRWWVSRSTGTSFSTTAWDEWSTRTGWAFVGVGDANGDGRSDILGFHGTAANWWVASSSGSSFTSARRHQYAAASNWAAHGLGDVDGDGASDVFSYNTGNRSVWWGSARGTEATSGMRWISTLPENTRVDSIMSGNLDGGPREEIVAGSPGTGFWGIYNRESGTRAARIGP